MDEIKKVLELLEAGKISAEEAERLIKAIRDVNEERKEDESGFFGISGLISDIVGKTVKDAIKFSKTSWSRAVSTEIPVKDDINISILGGEVRIREGNSDKVLIESKGGFYHLEEEKEIRIKGEADVQIPAFKNLYLKVLGGEVEMEGRCKNFSVKLMGGEIYSEADFEYADIYVIGGEFELKTERKPMVVKVREFGGDIDLPAGFVKKEGKYVFGENPEKKISLNLTGGEFILRFKS